MKFFLLSIFVTLSLSNAHTDTKRLKAGQPTAIEAESLRHELSGDQTRNRFTEMLSPISIKINKNHGGKESEKDIFLDFFCECNVCHKVFGTGCWYCEECDFLNARSKAIALMEIVQERGKSKEERIKPWFCPACNGIGQQKFIGSECFFGKDIASISNNDKKTASVSKNEMIKRPNLKLSASSNNQSPLKSEMVEANNKENGLDKVIDKVKPFLKLGRFREGGFGILDKFREKMGRSKRDTSSLAQSLLKQFEGFGFFDKMLNKIGRSKRDTTSLAQSLIKPLRDFEFMDEISKNMGRSKRDISSILDSANFMSSLQTFLNLLN